MKASALLGCLLCVPTTPLQIQAWFIAHRNPETGDYPELPEPDKGGSKQILNPPLPTVEEILARKEAEAAAAGGGKGSGSAEARGYARMGLERMGALARHLLCPCV